MLNLWQSSITGGRREERSAVSSSKMRLELMFHILVSIKSGTQKYTFVFSRKLFVWIVLIVPKANKVTGFSG